MRNIPDAAWQHLEKLIDSGVMLWLVSIEIDRGSEAFYLVNNAEAIDMDSVTFQPWPVRPEFLDDGGEGNLTETTLTIANIGRIASTYLEAQSWDQGRVKLELVVKGTLGPFDSGPKSTGLILEYAIVSIVERDDAIVLNLGQPSFFNRPVPPRRYIRAAGFPSIPWN